MKKIAYMTSGLVGLLAPVMAFAQINSRLSTGRIDNADQVINKVIDGFNIAIYLLISFAVLYIVWMVVRYFIMGDGVEKGEQAKRIGYGILGLFIILSIWGLVNILVRTFSTDNRIPTSEIPIIKK